MGRAAWGGGFSPVATLLLLRFWMETEQQEGMDGEMAGGVQCDQNREVVTMKKRKQPDCAHAVHRDNSERRAPPQLNTSDERDPSSQSYQLISRQGALTGSQESSHLTSDVQPLLTRFRRRRERIPYIPQKKSIFSLSSTKQSQSPPPPLTKIQVRSKPKKNQKKLTQLRMPQQAGLEGVHRMLARPPIDRPEIDALVRAREIRQRDLRRGTPAEGDQGDVGAAEGALSQDFEAVI